MINIYTNIFIYYFINNIIKNFILIFLYLIYKNKSFYYKKKIIQLITILK